MNLTASEKQAFIAKYDLLIWNLVHRFERRCSVPVSHRDDLYQECVLALLGHIENASDTGQMNRIPIPDLHNAMCRYVLSNQPAKVPKRTTDFGQIIHSSGGTVEFTAETLDQCAMDIAVEDVIDIIDFDSFVGKLPCQQREIVSLKRTNHTNREAARVLGISDVKVTRQLRRVQRSFEAFHAD